MNKTCLNGKSLLFESTDKICRLWQAKLTGAGRELIAFKIFSHRLRQISQGD